MQRRSNRKVARRSRNEGSHTRSAAGIKQGYGKNAANATWGKIHTARGAQHETSKAAQQERSKSHKGAQKESSRNPKGNHKKFGRAVTGNATKTQRTAAGKQELGRTATGTQQKRQGAHPEPSRKSRGIQQGCATKTTGGAART